MGNKLNSADNTDMNTIEYSTTAPETTTNKYTPAAKDDTSETEYQMQWSTWYGYYNEVPELAAVIDKKAMWAVGKGFKADAATKKTLDKIRGNGKQTFNTLLSNMVKVYTIGGDFFAEIIRNARGQLVNLKPLNPGSIKIIGTTKGMIKEYQQFANNGDSKPIVKFTPKQMFHLPWNVLADSIHGESTIEKLKEIVESRKEATKDLRVVFHRYVKPLLIISVDEDDQTEVAKFKTKVDTAMEKSENLIVPKDTVDTIEKISIPQFSTLDPLPWIKYLEQQFIRAEGVPSVILGVGEDEIEASAKILYLAFQQMVEWNQKFLEEQIEAQLGIKIKLEFPASIAPEITGDDKKDPKDNKMNVTPGKDSQ